ncbi:MAG TPA: dihydrofolate reductase [Pyrinomonadaceae bacterium]|nr:dihydrofolate reductase [Pyrinomonadaceae bacterium]
MAIAKNFAIGKDGKLPWHYGADLKFFKEMTIGHAVLMGANTWRSIGKPLPGRLNIVLSRRGDIKVPDEVRLVDSKGAALAVAAKLETDLYVIGGAEVFNAFAGDINKWIVTDVPIDVADADTFMPANFLDGFEIETRRELGGGLNARFLTRSRTKLV